MRVAIFSDVHGNSIALDAVLADVERLGGVDTHWFVGDAAAQGFDPVGALRTIAALPTLTAVRGNSDRFLVDFPDEEIVATVRLAIDDPGQAEAGVRRIRGLAWTTGAVTVTGHLEWLASPPLERRVTLPDGTRVLLVHSRPGTDDGRGITAIQSDDELAPVLDGAQADLVIVGHTHTPLDRTVNGVRAWNLGSVSNPATAEKRAMWTLLIADEAGYRLERQFAAYDAGRMLHELDHVRYPAAANIRRCWDEA